MKKWVLPLLLSGFMACSTSKDANKPAPDVLSFASTIDSAFIYKHLSVIAHDSLEGRDTGSEGQMKAAQYIISYYKKWGVRGGMPDGSYLQPVELNSKRTNSITYSVYSGLGDGATLSSSSVTNKESFADIVQLFGGSQGFKADVVYAGFGLSDAERGITPFEGVDVKGKWVLAFQKIPTVVDGDTIFAKQPNMNAHFREIFQQHGAKGLLLIPETEESFEKAGKNAQKRIGQNSGLALAYLDNGSGGNRGFGFSYGIINPSLAAQLIGLANKEALADEYKAMAKQAKTFRAKSLDYQIEVAVDETPVTVMSYNIVGIIDGVDPVKKDEFVVLSAHYDHVGISAPDEHGDTINNGADDDGSGTVGIFGAAEALIKAKAAGVGPKRSVMILHVTGEEKGLLGSRFYSDHPLVPIENTIANVNVDMIGRVDPDYGKDSDYIYIIGASLISSDMERLLEVANDKTVKIDLDMRYNDLEDPNQFYRRSDHWNFGRLGVPFSFFFNGVHEDYHRPGDEIHKIAFQQMAKRSQLLYAYVIELANMEGRPQVDNQEFINKTKTNARM